MRGRQILGNGSFIPSCVAQDEKGGTVKKETQKEGSEMKEEVHSRKRK